MSDLLVRPIHVDAQQAHQPDRLQRLRPLPPAGDAERWADWGVGEGQAWTAGDVSLHVGTFARQGTFSRPPSAPRSLERSASRRMVAPSACKSQHSVAATRHWDLCQRGGSPAGSAFRATSL